MKARATSSAREIREQLGNRRRALERLRGLVGVGRDRRLAQALDVLVEAGRTAFAKDASEERAEHPHIGAHALGELLFGLVAPDEVDGFGAGQFRHSSTVMPACFGFVTRYDG